MRIVHSSDRKEKLEKFVPGKSYKWEPSDLFALTGEEFSMLLEVARQEATNPVGAPAAAKVQVLAVLENLLIAGVETGIVVEMPKEVEEAEEVPLPGQ